MTIETVVARIVRNQPNRSSRPIKQQAIDAINELLSESMPYGPDAIAEGHDMAAQLDAIVVAASQALGLETKQDPIDELCQLIEALTKRVDALETGATNV